MQVEGSLLLQKFSNFMRQEEQKVLRREANIKKMTRNDSGGKMVVVVVVVLVLVVMVALVSLSGCIDTANLWILFTILIVNIRICLCFFFKRQSAWMEEAILDNRFVSFFKIILHWLM